MISKLLRKLQENSIVKNSFIVMIGQSGASFISFISMFLMLKAIGIYGQGIITIAQSYTNIFNAIFNFQSYNAMIKYGAEAIENKDKYKLKQYIKQSIVQDLITAVLAYLAGIIFINLISNFMGWDSNITTYVKMFLITILFNITGSINGFLRLNNEFKVGSIISITIALIKLFFTAIVVFIKGNIIYFIYIEVLTAILTNILFFIFGYINLKKNDLNDFWKVKIKFDKEFTLFNFYNNIVSTIDMPTGTLVNLIINKMLGITEVGIYSVLVKLGLLITKITDPIAQSLLPELSKLVAKNKQNEAYRLVRKIFLLTFTSGIILIVGCTITSPIWFSLFMELNLKNIILFDIYYMYITIISALSGIHLLFISLNLVKYNIKITIICNVIYLILLFILANTLGLLGIIISLIIQAVMIASIKYKIIKKNNDIEY